MAAETEFHSPMDESFQRLEPVVFLGDDCYIKTRRAGDGLLYVTTQGVEHPLRRFCPRRTLQEHLIRRNADAARHHLQNELVRLRAANHEQELRYFVAYLRPAFSGRDWSGNF